VTLLLGAIAIAVVGMPAANVEIAVAPDVRTQACAGSQPVASELNETPMMVNQEIGALDVSPADCGL